MTLIRLPWPPRSLHPNSRKDRRAATSDRQMYRKAGFYGAKEVKAVVPANAHLCIFFYPPDNRKRDLDGLLSNIKSGLDGIAAATCGDDDGWSYSIYKAGKVDGGSVVIKVEVRE